MCIRCKRISVVSRRLTGVVLGDPHFITFDGLSYTFNGKGEFYLVTLPDRELSVQARTEQVKLKNGESTFDVKALSVSPLSSSCYYCSSFVWMKLVPGPLQRRPILWFDLGCFILQSQD